MEERTMKKMLNSSKTLLILAMLLSVSLSFGALYDIGDVPFETGFEVEETVIDSLENAFSYYWLDTAPDTLYSDEGDTLVKNEDFDGADIALAEIVSDQSFEGDKSLYLTNLIDSISMHGGAAFTFPDSELVVGAEYTLTFQTKYELTEGDAFFTIGGYDDTKIEGTWTGLSDGWEEMSYEFRWMETDPTLSFGMDFAKGNVWVDNVELKQSGEKMTELVNADFEEASLEDPFNPKGWQTVMGIIGYANNAEDSTNYAYLDGEGVNGSKCVKMLHTVDDTGNGSVDWIGWWTDFPFINNGIYEISMDVKAEHLLDQTFELHLGWFNYNVPFLTPDSPELDDEGSTDGYVTVTDTIAYQTTPWHTNRFRFRVTGGPHSSPDSLMEVWVDNVRLEQIGTNPAIVAREDIKVTKSAEGEYTLHFTPQSGVTYNILQEPMDWTTEDNLLSNPSFEEADTAGNLADWQKFDEGPSDNFDAAYMAWLTPEQGMGIDGSGCIYVGPEDIDNQDKGICASWRQYYPSDEEGTAYTIDESMIYLYSTMAKYDGVELALDRTSKVTPDDNEALFNLDPTPEDSLNIAGVYIYPRYYHDAWHIDDPYYPQTLGYEKKLGSSNGEWEEQAYPFVPAGAFWTEHFYHLGMGHQYPLTLPMYGEVFFDDAAIVPFEEIQTGAGGEVTVNVPDSTRWLGIYGVSSEGGFQGSANAILIDTATVQTSVDDGKVAGKFELNQNYPNPFNPTTNISYTLPAHQKVTLTVYDMIGRKVKTLVDGKFQTAGNHKLSFNAENMASGVYFYRLKSGGKTITKKMLLLK
jgi:hypothetical protein